LTGDDEQRAGVRAENQGGMGAISHLDEFPQSQQTVTWRCFMLAEKIDKVLRPDSKGRVALGDLAKGVSSFHVTYDGDRIILEPFAEVPAREKWLFDNPKALASVKRGIADLAEGKTKSRGSFAKYVDDSDE
jgi:hypothetical protein